MSYLVQQSIAHVVADGTAMPLDESAPVRPTAVTQSAASMEQMIASCGLRSLVLRGGAFYGPGTGRDEFWRLQARAGQSTCPSDGQSYVSLIHVADVATAFVRALAKRPTGVMAIVDDEPVKYRDLFNHIAALENSPTPADGGPPLWPSFRVSNAAARAALEWARAYSSYRSGFC